MLLSLSVPIFNNKYHWPRDVECCKFSQSLGTFSQLVSDDFFLLKIGTFLEVEGSALAPPTQLRIRVDLLYT